MARLAARKVATSLGPMGLYKLVTYNRGPELVVKPTKDVTEVVKELGVQYPSIRILSEAAALHRAQVGDGVARLLMLVSSLLDRADVLIEEGLHPMTVLDGYHEANGRALALIESRLVTPIDTPNSIPEVLKSVDCGRNILGDELRRSIAEAVGNSMTDGAADLRRVRVTSRVGGSVSDSETLRGVVLKRSKLHPSMADIVEAPRIALVASGVGAKRLEVKMKGEGRFPIALDIRSHDGMSLFKEEERRMKRDLASHIASTGATVVISRSQIPESVGGMLANLGIFAVGMVEADDMDVLSFSTGAKMVGRAEDLTSSDLGTANRIEVGKNQENQDTVTVLSERGRTLVLRGGSSESVAELERAVGAAKTVAELALRAPKAIAGAGASEMALAVGLRAHARRISGRQQLAVQAFADSLEEIPEQLATNFGLNAIDTMAELRSIHGDGKATFGVLPDGCGDAEGTVMELSAVLKNTINRAYELSSLILRIDDLIHSTEVAVVHKQ